MDGISISTDMMQYFSEIQQATFGQKHKPDPIEQETVTQIAKSAKHQQSFNRLDDIMKSNVDVRQERKAMAEGEYNADGSFSKPRSVAGIDIVV